MIYLLVCDFIIRLRSTNRLLPTELCGGVHRLVRVCVGVCKFFGYMFDKFGLLVTFEAIFCSNNI